MNPRVRELISLNYKSTTSIYYTKYKTRDRNHEYLLNLKNVAASVEVQAGAECRHPGTSPNYSLTLVEVQNGEEH